MSTYQKCQPSALPDFDGTSGGLQHGALNPYAQAPYSTQVYTPVLESHPSDDESIQYAVKNGYASSPFEFPRSPSLEVASAPAPEVIRCEPSSGTEGTKLSIRIRSTVDVLNPVPWTFTLNFGSSSCECSVAALGIEESLYNYALIAQVPSFSSTESTTLSVPLQLVMENPEGPTNHFAQVGAFSYQQCLEAISTGSRKRRLSCGSDDTSASHNSSAKHLRTKESPKGTAYAESVSVSPYSPYLPTPASMTGYPPANQRIPSPLPPPQMDVYGNVSQSSRVKAPSPLASSWSPTFPDSAIADFNPRYNMTPMSQAQELPLTVRAGQTPTLIRTSTIQQSCTGPNPPFNPYSMYPSKAVLKLNGDLDSMADNWTQDEQDAQRRLVQFTRQQTGSTIHADFAPVTPNERVPNSICISCIYWAGKKECFVTSVDTIYLLESLVGVRFTVEEKNRIRRNLEGFRPLTVSKAKADSEDFFKVIMGFPNPKPRNIEKDVKVFPWRILAHALKKIIGKYSASYSSTASTLQASLGSNYSNGSLDLHSRSPSSIVNVPNSFVPNMSAQFRAPMYGSPRPSVPGPIRVVVPSADNQPAGYDFNRARHLSSPAVVGRQPGFDFNVFVNNSPVSSSPAVHHELAYSYPGNPMAPANHAPYVLGHPASGV